MTIASITGWLESKDRSYRHGAALYEQYGDNRALLALIKSGSSSYHQQKLIAALLDLNSRPNIEPKPIVINPAPASATPLKDNSNTRAPEAIEAIYTEKTTRYAQARKLFEMIRLMDSRQHRLDAALQLLDHMDFVNESWAAIDHWKETGKVRELLKQESATEIKDLALADLIKESKNLPTYISRDSKKLSSANLTTSKKIKITERLQKNTDRLELIKEQLKNALQ